MLCRVILLFPKQKNVVWEKLILLKTFLAFPYYKHTNNANNHVAPNPVATGTVVHAKCSHLRHWCR